MSCDPGKKNNTIGKQEVITECASMKINFNKIYILGINSGEDFFEVASDFLHCKVATFPLKFLGIQVGLNSRNMEVWRGVVNGIKKRLSSWKHKYISIGERVTLFNSVINSMPIHFLSFYKPPKSILKELVNIQRAFLWRGVKNGAKIAWLNGKSFVNQNVMVVWESKT